MSDAGEPLFTFMPPRDLDQALQVITCMSLYLDFWAARTGEWSLFQLITKTSDRSVWNTIATCVVTPSGMNLESVDIADLGVAGMLKAMQVFCEGLMQLEIPSIYLHHCAGITSEGISCLIRDAQKLKQELRRIEDPHTMLSHLFAHALSGSL